jgi:acyl-CoA hydrolase
MKPKPARLSRAVKSAFVLPPDTNHYGTIFGGKVMAYIDDVAAISATRHARKPVVTASTDSVDFLHPIKNGQSICLESFVTWTRKTSMEVFVKVVAEDLLTGQRKVCATSFLTFVALGEDGKPCEVPPVQPETELEKILFEGAEDRAELRKQKRASSRQLARQFGVAKPWEL